MSLISESLKRAHDDRSTADLRPAFNLVDSPSSSSPTISPIKRWVLWLTLPALGLAGFVVLVLNPTDTRQVARVAAHQASTPASPLEYTPASDLAEAPSTKKTANTSVNPKIKKTSTNFPEPSTPKDLGTLKAEPAKEPVKKNSVPTLKVKPVEPRRKDLPAVKSETNKKFLSAPKKVTLPKKKKSRVQVTLTQKKSPVKKAVVASLPNKENPGAKQPLTGKAPGETLAKDAEFYFKMGVFYQRTKDPIEALDYYNKALQLDPTNAEIYNNRSLIYKELGKYDKAVTGFLKAIHFDPEYVKAYNNIGLLYFLKNNPAAAISSFQKAIKIDPRNVESYNNLASVYKKQDNPLKALELYQAILKKNPGHIEAHYNLALLYEQEGNYPKAITHYSQFAKLGATLRPKLVQKVKAHLKLLQ